MLYLRVGDITPHDNVSVEEKHRLESEAINELASLLNTKQSLLLKDLYQEYEAKESLEARITKDLDIFDMVHQAYEYEKRIWKETHVIPDLEEFFNPDTILSKIKSQQIQGWVKEVVGQRKVFLDSIKSGLFGQTNGNHA